MILGFLEVFRVKHIFFSKIDVQKTWGQINLIEKLCYSVTTSHLIRSSLDFKVVILNIDFRRRVCLTLNNPEQLWTTLIAKRTLANTFGVHLRTEYYIWVTTVVTSTQGHSEYTSSHCLSVTLLHVSLSRLLFWFVVTARRPFFCASHGPWRGMIVLVMKISLSLAKLYGRWMGKIFL